MVYMKQRYIGPTHEIWYTCSGFLLIALIASITSGCGSVLTPFYRVGHAIDSQTYMTSRSNVLWNDNSNEIYFAEAEIPYKWALRTTDGPEGLLRITGRPGKEYTYDSERPWVLRLCRIKIQGQQRRKSFILVQSVIKEWEMNNGQGVELIIDQDGAAAWEVKADLRADNLNEMKIMPFMKFDMTNHKFEITVGEGLGIGSGSCSAPDHSKRVFYNQRELIIRDEQNPQKISRYEYR